MRNIFLLAITLAVFASSPVHAAEGIQWLRLHQDGFTLEYEQSEAGVAAQVMPEIIRRFKSYHPGDLGKELDIMKTRRNDVLVWIASELGMDKPSTQMTSVFDKFVLLFPALARSLSSARDFRLWNRTRLQAILSSGEGIPGFSYIAKNDDISFNIRATDPSISPFTGPLPLVLNRSQDDFTGQISSQLDTYENVIRNIPGAGIICHETAEIAMSADLGMTSPFRRWVIEGAANHIAAKGLKKFVGGKSARDYTDGFSTKTTPETKLRVDLVAWRAMEWDRITPPWVESDLTQAYYNHATEAFERYVAGSRPGAVSRLIRLIVASKDRSDAAIYAALRKITGKDIRKVLETEYQPIHSPFRGFAARVLDVRPMTRKPDSTWETLETSDVIPFSRDRRKGFKMIFEYATLGQPVELKVEFIGEGMKTPDRFVQTLTRPQDTIAVDMVFGEGELKPGPSVLTVYINGAVLQTRKLQIKGTL